MRRSPTLTSTRMKSFPILRHMLLCALLMISARVLALPTELDDLQTVTKTIYHRTVQRRSGGALAHLGSDGNREILSPLYLVQRRNDPSDDLTHISDAGTLTNVDLERFTKRSASLYALRIPFVKQEGYIARCLSNTTAASLAITSAPKKASASTFETSDKPTPKPKSTAPLATEADDESSLTLEQSTSSKTIASSKPSEIASQCAEKSKSAEKESAVETDLPKIAFHNDHPTITTNIQDGSQATPADNVPALTKPPSVTVAATNPPPTMSNINSFHDHINSYIYRPTPTPTPGAALRTRAFENAGVPRVAMWWKRDRKPVPKHDEVDNETASSSSSRIPAKPCPTQSSATHNTHATTTPSFKPDPATLLNTPSTTSSPPLFHPSPYDPPSPPSLNSDLSYSFLTPTSPPSNKPPPFRPPKHNPYPPSAPSTESVTTEPHDPSAAWGHIADPRMRWTVEILWVVAGLQVALGVWEFIKGVRGRAKVWGMGRVGWWDGKVREAG